MKLFETKYRIVTWGQKGFAAEFRLWWWPFWLDCGPYFRTREEAEQYAFRKKNKVIKYL